MSYEPGAIVEFRVGYEVNDQLCLNVLHYFAEGSTPGVEIEDIQAAAGAYFGTDADGRLVQEMLEMMSADAVVMYLDVQQIYPTRIRSTRTVIERAGEIAENATAQNVAAVIEKHGRLATRSAIGSFHLGGLPSTLYAAGELTAPAKLQLAVIAGLLKNAVVVPGELGATYTPCILNKEPIPLSNPVKYQISGGTEVTGTIPKDTLRTMRRRTKGYGD